MDVLTLGPEAQKVNAEICPECQRIITLIRKQNVNWCLNSHYPKA